VNAEKTYVYAVSCYQKAGQMHNMKIVNSSFEGVAKFKCLRTAVTDQNCMHEQTKCSECLLPHGSVLSSHLLSTFVLYGCETWSVTLREEHRLRVFEKRVPRRIF
jgi:hypothetical protein